MNWLNNIRPKIRALVGKKQEVPENLWSKCPQCEQMIFHRELEAALHVCSHCGHHLRIDARTRIASILDADELGDRRAGALRGRPAQVPRPQALCRAPARQPQPDRRRRCDPGRPRGR